MIEVYRDTSERVLLHVYVEQQLADPDNGWVYVEIVDADTGEVFHESDVPTGFPESTGVYSIVIPAAATRSERTLAVKWRYEVNGEVYTPIDYVQVVTPYVSVSELKTEFPSLADRTFDELKSIERTVRYVIEQFCGQSFGKRERERIVLHGSASRMLSLPKRVLRVHNLYSETTDVQQYVSLVEGGWAIANPYSAGYVNVKADIGLTGSARWFGPNRMLTLIADTGYERVPAEVSHAAKLLIAKYLRPEAEWHSNNVQSVGMADMRLEFAEKPMNTTGDANVDKILARWRIQRGWAV